MIPEWLEENGAKIDTLHADILFGGDDGDQQFAGDDPEAVQYFLLSLSALKQAEQFMKLAHLKQMQAVAAHQRGR